MKKYYINIQTARKYLLLKHNLLGDYVFNEDEESIIKCIRNLHCIQYDPIDICGKNANLVLNARCANYSTDRLASLLYKQHVLMDYWDKNMSIILTDDWPYFKKIQYRAEEICQSMHDISDVLAMFEEKQAIKTSIIIEYILQKLGSLKNARLYLHYLWVSGKISIVARKNEAKYYSLTRNTVPENIINLPDPFRDFREYYKWQLLRRIKSVGMLRNRNSDAFLGISNFTASIRNTAIKTLFSENKLVECNISNSSEYLYISITDEEILQKAISNEYYEPRIEFLGPLDNLLWDRKLIKIIFDFDYKWEIYIPKDKRIYSPYTIPIIYNDCFAGRMGVMKSKDKAVLILDHFWPEKEEYKSILDSSQFIKRFKQFAAFNDCTEFKIKPSGVSAML